ncbi:MAG: hypothetical protein IPH68_11700 [Chitinophagaceae bacterium]|nr:hypothetical protein [Chitinophagaceae bacterium]MBK7559471.1 hypothetical protein [Chitinophagaceae bacterium]MBK9531077.1 hypothetical protein [Chitinophagaceae bacterium]
MPDKMDTINYTLFNKLQNLVSFLTQANRGFHEIAEDVDCNNLKTALIALAVESRQYANEISDRLLTINLQIPHVFTDQLWEKIETNIYEQASPEKGSEIAALCNNCEIYFAEFYNDVLNEPLPHKKFKDIITYQLLATQCAFMKIRLLNTLRFNN